MQKVTYTNARGESIEIGHSAPFYLSKLEGVGDVSVDVVTTKPQYQHGERYRGAYLGRRPIFMEVTIKGNTIEELYLRRQEISRVFSPGLGTFRYQTPIGTYEIKAVPESLPRFPSGRDRTETRQKCFIDLICPDPLFSMARKRDDLAMWIPLLEFDVDLVDEGIEFEYRAPSLIVNVINTGHVPTGMEIHFKALSTVQNPQLINVNTQEFLKINRAMRGGETIVVNTTKGKKSAISNIDGSIRRTINPLESTYLQLDVGDNLFRYAADENLEGLEVTIYHTPKLLGV